MKIKNIYFLIVFLGFLLPSCNSMSELWIYKDESWKLERSFEINYDILPSFSIEGLGFDTGAIVESFMDVVYPYAVQLWNQDGINVSYKKNTSGNNIKYNFLFKGNSLDSFLKLYKIDQELIQSDEYEEYAEFIEIYTPKIKIDKISNNRYLLIIDYQSYGEFGMLGEKFILHGNNIDSNSFIENKTKAEWNSPTVIQAKFSPSNKILANPIVKNSLVTLGLSFCIFIAVFYLKGFAPKLTNSRDRHSKNNMKKNPRSNYGNRRRR